MSSIQECCHLFQSVVTSRMVSRMSSLLIFNLIVRESMSQKQLCLSRNSTMERENTSFSLKSFCVGFRVRMRMYSYIMPRNSDKTNCSIKPRYLSNHHFPPPSNFLNKCQKISRLWGANLKVVVHSQRCRWEFVRQGYGLFRSPQSAMQF